MSRVGRMEWYFDYPNMTPAANQDTLANPFQWSFPENNTDSVVPYKIRLFTWAPYNACPDDIGKTVLIKPGVNADFTVSDSTGCHPLNVSFNNLSTGHLDNQSYYWDFGDGLESYDSLPVHNYINFNSSTVTFDARLIVTSPLDCKDTASRKIEVFPYIKGSLLVDSATRCSPIHSTLSPVNSIGVDTFFYTIQSPQFVQSIKRVTKEEITLTYSDTTYSNGPDTIRTTLVVQNRMGCSDTVSARNIVVYPEVAAKFDVDEIEICDNSQIQISNQSFGQNVLYTWDFGDGSSSRDSTLTAFMHTFYNPGDIEKDFVITLEGLNEYLCSDTYDTIITVFPRVNAFFTIESGNNCAPLNLRIENLSHRVETYEWDYGDGSPLDNTSAPVFYHYYENPLPDRDTTYILTLRVESPEGCYDSIKRNVYLLPQVVADFDMSDSVGCSPATVTFQNNSTGMDLLYSWQFGDLVKSNNNLLFSEVFQNLSANDSTFDVVLTAINSQGCESSMTRHFTIYPFVNAVFGVDNQTRCSPFTVNTFNYSSAGSKNYSWSFGDGNKSNAFEPSHQYVNNSLTLRRDTLRLIVNNDHACYDTAMKIITVYPELHVDFQVSEASGCQPLLVSFENLTNIIPNTSFFWDFDDETYSTSAVPSPHTFTNVSPGSVIRNIQLAGISQYGCSDTFIRQVEIFPEVYAHFITDKPAVCSGDSFLIDRSTSRGAISNYYWDFNSDGITDDLRTDDSFSYSFENTSSSPVTMNLKLTVANEQGCDTSWSRTLMVYPAVNAGFVVDASSTCYPNPSVFQNISQFKGIVATKFTWNFGDGTYSTSINDQISHNYRNFTYDQDREYVVNLVAESDYHCSDSFTDTVLIHPKPKADFEFAGKSAGCPPFTPNINNTSEGTNLSYSWTLENGSLSSSTDFEPVSTFENVTNDILSNKITLVTTTEFDCRDTSEMILMVYPGVTADFTASPQWAGCDPLILDLDGLHNENAVNFMWDFDDGSTSTLEDPQHLFTNDEITDREFEVYFRALSAYGCEDDTVKIVTVYSSPSPEFSSTPMLQEYDTVNDMTSVTFTNLTEHQDIWDYEWDFGDNTTSDNNNPAFTHTYGNLFWGEPLNNHAVLVKLYAANRNNPECSNSISHDIVILPPRPQINIGEDVSGCVPLEVGFSATVKYTDDTYDWDFGYNNETSTEAEPVFEYTEPGIYMVRLIVNGPGGINVDSKEITVYANPEVDFTFAPSEVLKESQTEPSEEIKFYNNTNFAESYEWYYRYDADYERIEEPFSVEKEPFLTLNDTGYYWVTLVAETSHGCRDSFIHPTPIYVKGTKEFEMPDYFYVDPDNITSGTYKKGVPMDGLFFPRSMGVEKYKLEIYNRWGELIFSTDNINTGWNGCIDNNPEHPVSQGVYVWKVKATFTNGQTKMYAGDVTLLINPERSTPDNKLF
jgi:PKD repeat protein